MGFDDCIEIFASSGAELLSNTGDVDLMKTAPVTNKIVASIDRSKSLEPLIKNKYLKN